MSVKNDAQLIENEIELQKAKLVGRSRKWWPNYVYHTTSLENAVSILHNNKLMSRNDVLALGDLKKDIADSSVISSTNAMWKDYARFYLRPKTPTLYRNEGVKPQANIVNGAHCPVPICFMFDSKKILTRADCIFSDGNLGSQTAKTGSDSSFFSSIPFDKVFHVGAHNGDRSITYHRCAEAVIPNFIGLEDLSYICCRSEAEKETLLDMLEMNVRSYWKNKIGVTTRYSMFNEEWNFIREVKWDGSRIVLKFNEQLSNARGPFKLEIGISQYWNGNNAWVGTEIDYTLPNDYAVTLNGFSNKSLHVWVKLDSQVVYQNSFYSTDDSPF